MKTDNCTNAITIRNFLNAQAGAQAFRNNPSFYISWPMAMTVTLTLIG
ncbi:hypothetical protein ABE527_17935 [Brucella sp. TWI432]